MTDDRKARSGEEVRSPLQVTIRILLALFVVAILVGLILAVVLRPERSVEPPEEAGIPSTDTVLAHVASRLSDAISGGVASPDERASP